jgi:hypothetical protein
MDSMVHPWERAIHVVKSDTPQRLTGLSQKGTGAGPGSRQSPVMDTERSRRTERPSPVLVKRAERGKPVSVLAHAREESHTAT